MRPINFIITVVLLFVVGTAGMAAQEMQEITPVKAREMVKSGKASLLDVRTQQEWDLGHLEKASRVDVMDKDFKKKNPVTWTGQEKATDCVLCNRRAKRICSR